MNHDQNAFFFLYHNRLIYVDSVNLCFDNLIYVLSIKFYLNFDFQRDNNFHLFIKSTNLVTWVGLESSVKVIYFLDR